MPLIVETGAVVANANSYVSLDDANAYHAARGNSTWTGTDAAKEAAVLRAMDYLEKLNWQGDDYDGPAGASGKQPLKWPRRGVVLGGYVWPWDEVHPGVQNALCEAALIELTDPGALAPAFSLGVKREKLGPMETEYFGPASGEVYHTIMQHLRGLVAGGVGIELKRG